MVNRSIHPWNPPALPTPELVASLDMRIRVATDIIVLVGDYLADSPCCRLEIEDRPALREADHRRVSERNVRFANP